MTIICWSNAQIICLRTEKNRQYAIQSVFHAQPGKELCTSTIPLLARIRPDNIGISKMVWTIIQIFVQIQILLLFQATITEIGTFPGIKQFTIRQTKTIDQNDVFNESDEEFEKEFVKDEPENIDNACLENEEEIVIEDFDDQIT